MHTKRDKKNLILFMLQCCYFPRVSDSSTQTDELTFEQIEAIVAYLKARTSIVPDVGIICGSGLGGLGDNLDTESARDVVPYSDIPNFPKTTGK